MVRLLFFSFTSNANDFLSFPMSVTFPVTDFACCAGRFASPWWFAWDCCGRGRACAERPPSNRPARDAEKQNFRIIGIHLLECGQEAHSHARFLPGPQVLCRAHNVIK